MEKTKLETAVASILRAASGSGGISVHVTGGVHLYQVGALPVGGATELQRLLAALGELVTAAKEQRR